MDITQIRKENLLVLIEKFNTQSEFAQKAGTSTSYLSQIKKGFKSNGTPVFMGSEIARKIEVALGLGHGWMDTIHSKTSTQQSLELSSMSMSMGSMSLDAEKKQSQPRTANVSPKVTDPHLLLAYEQGRAESLKTICLLLIKKDPEYAQQVLERFIRSDLINEKVNTHVQDAPALEKNYAQTVLAAWSSTGIELMAFVQSIKNQQ